ncbi:hypothetical protein J6590_095631 [Homalodisca vitripennis]|nr:hypothetical protein J6590_095631 [Homalodisca vitripennis]
MSWLYIYSPNKDKDGQNLRTLTFPCPCDVIAPLPSPLTHHRERSWETIGRPRRVRMDEDAELRVTL